MIRTERDRSTDVVVLDRPEKRNALTVSGWRDLAAAVNDLSTTAPGEPVVIRGAGGYFCAGADLADLAAARADPVRAEGFVTAIVAALLAVHRSPRPTVALVERGAAGGGVELMLACDHRLALGDGSLELVIPFGRRGIVPDLFTRWRLDVLAGTAVGARLAQGDHRIDGTEAASLGLLDGAAPAIEDVTAAVVERQRSAWWPGLAEPGDPVARAAAPMLASVLAGSAGRE